MIKPEVKMNSDKGMRPDGIFRSSKCDAGLCVEVSLSQNGETVMVRGSAQPKGPRLSFSCDEWQAFLAGCARGDFDLPQ